MEAEMAHYATDGVNFECGECKNLKAKLLEKQTEIEAYKNGLCNLKNVESVYIKDGRIMCHTREFNDYEL